MVTVRARRADIQVGGGGGGRGGLMGTHKREQSRGVQGHAPLEKFQI